MNRSLFFTFIFFLSLLLQAQEPSPSGLKVGDHAPDFTAVDQNGKRFHLYSELQSKPVVLIFYRGEWCPHCDKHLSAVQDSLSFILDKGASVIAIAPELPESAQKMAEKTGATFPLIHDKEYNIMNAYDVAFTVDEETVKRYKKWNIHLDQANGDDSNTLPVPATYIISQDKKISFVHFDPNYKYKYRATVKSILENL